MSKISFNQINQINQDKPPKIAKFTTQCSNICVQNWSKYNQTPPIGHYCSCTKNQFFSNLNTKLNLTPEQIDN